ncbi:MAG: hypothetical protein C5S45_01345, partial [Candidatus Methanocomedens sp.]
MRSSSGGVHIIYADLLGGQGLLVLGACPANALLADVKYSGDV